MSVVKVVDRVGVAVLLFLLGLCIANLVSTLSSYFTVARMASLLLYI
jgi:hypothetical protein